MADSQNEDQITEVVQGAEVNGSGDHATEQATEMPTLGVAVEGETNVNNSGTNDDSVVVLKQDGGQGDRSSEGHNVVHVKQPVGSGSSTVSLIESIDDEVPGSEAWKIRKQDLLARLQRAKERQRNLLDQLNVQKEKFRLEQQEKNNSKLEQKLKSQEDQSRLVDMLQDKEDELESLKKHNEEKRKTMQLRFKQEQQELLKNVQVKHLELEHQLEMERLQKEQLLQERAIQHDLQQARASMQQERISQLETGATDNATHELQTEDGTACDIQAWMRGVRASSVDDSRIRDMFRTNMPSRPPPDSSGVNILSSMGLDKGMTDFILSQQSKAGGRPIVRGSSVPPRLGSGQGRMFGNERTTQSVTGPSRTVTAADITTGAPSTNESHGTSDCRGYHWCWCYTGRPAGLPGQASSRLGWTGLTRGP